MLLLLTVASGGDGIPVELFQILKDDAVKVLHSVCQKIWKTQQWPQVSTYKWYHLIFFFSEWFTLTDYDNLQVYPCCCKWHFFSFYGWVTFHCTCIPHFLYPFICWWTFRLLMLLWTLGCIDLFKLEFSLDIYPGVELLHHMATLVF